MLSKYVKEASSKQGVSRERLNEITAKMREELKLQKAKIEEDLRSQGSKATAGAQKVASEAERVASEAQGSAKNAKSSAAEAKASAKMAAKAAEAAQSVKTAVGLLSLCNFIFLSLCVFLSPSLCVCLYGCVFSLFPFRVAMLLLLSFSSSSRFCLAFVSARASMICFIP